jgi:transposase
MDVRFREASDRQKLQERIAGERQAMQRDRLRAALLAAEGREAVAIAAMLNRSRRFVQQWAYTYRDGGIEKVRAGQSTGRPPKLPREREPAFVTRVLAGPTDADGGVCTLRGEDTRRILEREFGVHYTLDGVYDLLHRLKLSCLVPRPRHRKNDPAAMAAWLEKAPLIVQEVKQAHPQQEVEVWFQDEARIGQQGTLTRVWAQTGSRPTAVKQTEYEWAYLFAAANPLTGVSSALIAPTVNTAYMNQHLAFIGREAGPDKHVVLVLDQAGWHVAKALKVPDNITLLHLPPYSPELNGAERIWGYLRSHYLSNRIYKDYNELFEAIKKAWNRLAPQRLASLTHCSWIERAA